MLAEIETRFGPAVAAIVDERNDPQQYLWYYRSLFGVYERRNHTWMVAELRRVLDELGAEINASAQR